VQNSPKSFSLLGNAGMQIKNFCLRCWAGWRQMAHHAVFQQHDVLAPDAFFSIGAGIDSKCFSALVPFLGSRCFSASVPNFFAPDAFSASVLELTPGAFQHRCPS